jgi:hypothetical protein
MRFYQGLLLLLLSFTLSGCEVIAGIFEAGFWVGVIAVVVVLGLIGLLVSRMGGRR